MTTAHDLSTATWRKSSYSNGDGGACVEVADDFAGITPVRDSKHLEGPVLIFAAEEWEPFLDALKRETL